MSRTHTPGRPGSTKGWAARWSTSASGESMSRDVQPSAQRVARTAKHTGHEPVEGRPSLPLAEDGPSEGHESVRAAGGGAAPPSSCRMDRHSADPECPHAPPAAQHPSKCNAPHSATLAGRLVPDTRPCVSSGLTSRCRNANPASSMASAAWRFATSCRRAGDAIWRSQTQRTPRPRTV